MKLGELMDLIHTHEHLVSRIAEQKGWLKVYMNRDDPEEKDKQDLHVARLEKELRQLRATEINEKE